MSNNEPYDWAKAEEDCSDIVPVPPPPPGVVIFVQDERPAEGIAVVLFLTAATLALVWMVWHSGTTNETGIQRVVLDVASIGVAYSTGRAARQARK